MGKVVRLKNMCITRMSFDNERTRTGVGRLFRMEIVDEKYVLKVLLLCMNTVLIRMRTEECSNS